jgi:thioesterase domain-containing protein
MLGYSFGGLLALELVLQLEAEGHEGKLYLVDSAPDFMKAVLAESFGSNEDEFQNSFIIALFTLILPHEATSAAVSKVCHERNIKSYEYWNALSLGLWSFKFVALIHRWGSFHLNS